MHTSRKTFALAVLPLALALAPVACGGGSTTLTGGGGSSSTGSSTGTGTAAGPTAEAACIDEAAAECALRVKCFTSYDTTRLYGTEAVCTSRTQQTCLNALDAKGTGNSPAHVEGCAAAYPSEACADFDDANPVAACVPPAGTLAAGAACGASAQCESTYCAISQYAVCGTCAALPAIGASCQVQADCGRDLACVILADASSGTCAAYVASGGACLTDVKPCQGGLSCVGDDTTKMTTGTCEPAGATIGTACDSDRKAKPACDGSLGLACIPSGKGTTVGTCQNIALLGGGQTCGDIGTPVTSVVGCTNGGLCKKAAPSDKTGVCMPAAADGAACDNDPSIGPPCVAPAKCVIPAGSPGTAGTCTVPNAATCM